LVKLIEFLKTQCKTIFGGGHSVAAGFFVKKNEFENCKKLILENIDKFRN
jgi:nanoRNase/pAp phosphatase (c-di-AMP/oligoRNAs hydrolase)